MSAFELTWINLKKAWFDDQDFRGEPEDEPAYRANEDLEFKNFHRRLDHLEDELGREPTDEEAFGDYKDGLPIDERPGWRGAPSDHDHVNSPWPGSSPSSVFTPEELRPPGGGESPKERTDAPTLDPNHILRLTRPQLDKLIQDAKSEIKRRGTKKANKNVAVVDSPVKGMANANEWVKHNPWMGE